MSEREPIGRDAATPVFTMDAGPTPALPRMARTFVRHCSGLLDARASEAVLLLTSEMVTNAVQHARTERVTLTIERIGASLRVAVSDDDPAQPILRDRDDSRIGGLGVQMVDKLASAWGVDGIQVGKRVWFEVAAT